jgi:hypothetical protein
VPNALPAPAVSLPEYGKHRSVGVRSSKKPVSPDIPIACWSVTRPAALAALRRARIVRRHSEAGAKGAVEVRHIIEAGREGDVDHLAMRVLGVREQPVGLL